MFTGFSEYDELKKQRPIARKPCPLRTTHDERVWTEEEGEMMRLKRSFERATMRRIVKQLQRLKG